LAGGPRAIAKAVLRSAQETFIASALSSPALYSGVLGGKGGILFINGCVFPGQCKICDYGASSFFQNSLHYLKVYFSSGSSRFMTPHLFLYYKNQF
jgi:hypothetical protein